MNATDTGAVDASGGYELKKRERSEESEDHLQKNNKLNEAKVSAKRWTQEEDDLLRGAVKEFDQRNWKSIATRVPGRNHAQCLQRWNKVLKPGLVKGHWSFEEDSILEQMVLQGCNSWGQVANSIPGRTAKQCRERWKNHLDPNINKEPFSLEEDATLQDAFEKMGNRWTQIASLLPGRTEDQIKVRWKILNPNQKSKAKPGRPRLIPGMATNKSRSVPPSVVGGGVDQSSYDPILHQQPHHQQHTLPSFQNLPHNNMNYNNANGMIGAPVSTTQQPWHHQEQHQQHQQQQPHHQYGDMAPPANSAYVQQQTYNYEQDLAEANAVEELLSSQTERISLLSIDSNNPVFSSFSDLLPDAVLRSGDLELMLKSMSSSLQDSSNPKDLLNSYSKALNGMDQSEGKMLFHSMLEELKVGSLSTSDTTTYVGLEQEEGDVNRKQEEGGGGGGDDHLYKQSKHCTAPIEETSSFQVQDKRVITGDKEADIGEGIDDIMDPDMMRTFKIVKK